MPRRLRIRVTGVVQGVGFRPFVYSLAARLGLSGWVLNDSRGVELEAEGDAASLDALVAALSDEAPPLARVTGVSSVEIAPEGRRGFAIRESAPGGARLALVSPDVSLCADCLREMRDPADRRRGYPFINCTNCGPRYTIVRDVPYDRANTTMSAFEMCPDCLREYRDPADRRFHAEPIACPVCGPKVTLLDADGAALGVADPVAEARRALLAGQVVAVKGLGGFHLACDAMSEPAVARLRARKAREEKPLAVMCPDLESAEAIALVGRDEAKLLASPERPIVLVRKRPGFPLAPSVAPRNGFVGVMLPYTPLHELLVTREFRALVMTSGNLTDEPICRETGEALSRLRGIADLFLVHDRGIHVRLDDSVARVVASRPLLVRRARGYVPRQVMLLREAPPVLAFGADMKNAVCITRGREAFLGQHLGDLANARALDGTREAVTHLTRILGVEPSLGACDMHPAYLSTKVARESGLPLTPVQHHHAHIASCLAENGAEGPAIGLAFDGTGYGPDGSVWGGEFLVVGEGGGVSAWRRAGHFERVPQPGGDRAAAEPWRMALAWLRACFGPGALDVSTPLLRRLDWTKAEAVMAMMERGVNSPPTSSAGRLFDAAASLLSVRDVMSYEGQAAMELEGIADPGERGSYPCSLANDGGVLVVRAKEIIAAMVEDAARGAAPEVAAARFHNSVVEASVRAAAELRGRTGVGTVALSGGVWQNARLMEDAVGRLEAAGFRVLTHRLVPPNDGGVALGQAAVAAELAAGRG